MDFTYLTKDRPQSIKQITILFLIGGLMLSFRLWVGDRLFPLIPFIDGLENIPYYINYILFLFLILSLLYEIYKPNKWSLASGLIILFFLLLQDQNRLQPWVYIYILILLPFCFSYFLKTSEIDLIAPIKIIFIAMYFWTGLQKANNNFINGGFPQILANLFKIQDPQIIKNLLPLGYIIPTIEIFIAISLVSKKLRNLGVFLVVLTHIFILIYVSPIGINNNFIIYPWNVAMILLVIALFYKNNADFTFWDVNYAKATFLNYAYILFLGLLPILNFWGRWDDYLSFSLYSEKSKIFYIAISDKYIGQFDHKFDDYFLKLDDNIQGGKVININKWSMKELNVPVYPEIRVFEKISKDFCRYNIPDTDIMFLMYKGTVSNENLTKWTCNKMK
jgi:hypothetical protein